MNLLTRPLRRLRPLAYRLRTHPVLGRWALRAVPDLPLRVEVPGVGPLEIRMRRHRSYWLRDPLETEGVPFAMLRALVGPGDVVYDAGANLGLYTRFLDTLGAGEIVAFEPVASNRELFWKNVALGRPRAAIRCLPVALADRDAEEEFQVDDVQSTSGTLDRVTGGAPSEGRANLGLPPRLERVECRAIDSLVERGEIPPPDLVKLDVEGAEALVLEGARAVLAGHRPRLVVELHGAGAAREVAARLLDLGYACRGKVVPRLAAGGWADVDRRLLARLEGPYDLHFLAAAADPEALPESF